MEPDDIREVLGGSRILVVDDDSRNLFAVTSFLERYGVEIVPARSGREAIEVFRRDEDIDLVLMDIMMPEMDGYRTTQAIRRMPERAGIPIVALTAKAMPGDREKTLEAGCDDFVPKPVEGPRLLSTLRRLLIAARKR
ncbi:MAG: response regulator [Polyangiaceae bacterium]|nr:response regulator [Polyangiaceae bacterium]